MDRVKVTSRGRITIPKAIREQLGVGPGELVEFVRSGDTYAIVKFEPSPFDEWVGYLKHLKGQDVDALIEEMRGR